MDDKQSRRWRMEQLLRRQKAKQTRSYGLLFEECLQELGDNVRIFSEEASESMREELVRAYPFTAWGRIHWDQIAHHEVRAAQDIPTLLEALNIDHSLPIFIIWSGDHPVLHANLQSVLRALDHVLAVDFDTFVYNPLQYVIEFYHEGDITVAIEQCVKMK
ncbi:hypothetical protein [Paenibacillus sp. NPDC057967]|uniref:CDI toxin immunity protein n=1 Tax=Paenibacillus sp. NPDC057967 TaxID=3346293 RepID=UPI0036D7D989